MFPIAGSGPIDPLMLRAAVRVYKPQIDAFLSSGVAPDYVCSSVTGLVDAFERWGNEAEAARESAAADVAAQKG